MTQAAARWRSPLKVQLEPRVEQPGWLSLLITLGAVALALVLGGVVLALVGGSPLRAYGFMLRAAFGDLGVISDTLTKATPLILVSLAAVIPLRMRLWNIGAEGQFFIGAFGASAVVLAPLLPADSPSWILIPAMMLAGSPARPPLAYLPPLL